METNILYFLMEKQKCSINYSTQALMDCLGGPPEKIGTHSNRKVWNTRCAYL